MIEEFRIILQPEAFEGMESAYKRIEELQSTSAAHLWAAGLMDAIYSLKQFPHRCQFARENEFFPFEIRQLLYGTGTRIYRILFHIKDDSVNILHIRHSFQDTLRPNP